MQQQGVVPDIITYSALISTFGEGKQLERALEIVDQIQQQGIVPDVITYNTAAGDRFDRSRGRSIESIDSIDSIIFRSLAKFLKNRSWRDDRFRQKIVKIRAILAIFRPFENFGDFRFDRFDIFFDSIDTEPNDCWGPPCNPLKKQWVARRFRGGGIDCGKKLRVGH